MTASSHRASRPRPRRLSHLIHAVLIGGGALLALPAIAAAEPAAAAQSVRHYAVPAGQLDAALEAFSRASGLNITWSAAEASGRTTAGVTGSHDARAALTLLLQGTGLEARFDAHQGARIQPQLGSGNARVIAPLVVQGSNSAEGSAFGGYTSYDAQTARSLPAKRGHITSVLRLNPAVQFDNSADSSKMPGELEPADISIHGARFWQNLFTIDGISVNNDLNPGDRSYMNVNGSLTDLPGNKSQGIALDMGLVERIEAYDNNVPAEFGGFNGGVINAVTRNPEKAFGGSVSVMHTRDAWARYHIDARTRNAFNNQTGFANGHARNQPEFATTTYRVNLEGQLSDTFGLLGSLTRRTSTIYNQRAVNAAVVQSGGRLPEFVDVERRTDNVFLKGIWTPSDQLSVETTLTHEPWKSDFFNINAQDGNFEMESGGSAAGMVLTWQGERMTQTHRLNWSRQNHSRTGGPGWYQSWYHSPEKDWGDPEITGAWASIYGTFGNIRQGQESLEYRFKLDWEPLQLAGGTHHFAVGAGVTDASGWYERREAFTTGRGWAPTFTCTDINGYTDTRHCSTSPLTHTPAGWPVGSGQIMLERDSYQKGKVTVDQRALSAWVEDRMQYGKLDLRLGLRFDTDSYMSKRNIAPRIGIEYDLFGDGSTQLVAGANRYYGRNLYEYALSAKRGLMLWQQERDPQTLLWSEPVRGGLSNTAFGKLDIPYDDERVLGVRQIAWNTRFELTYVNRRGRDQIVSRYLEGAHRDPLVDPDYHYEYTNEGRSDTDSVMLSVAPLAPFEWAGTRSTLQFVANWTDVRSSYSNYQSEFDPATANSWVKHDGKFIRFHELPAQNYNRPWTARISALTEIPRLNLTVGNYLSWRGSHRQLVDTGDVVEYRGQPAMVYEERRFGTTATWDVRLMWEQPTRSGQALFANLDITNLLDRSNTISYSSAETVYELGRQFQLELGYKF